MDHRQKRKLNSYRRPSETHLRIDDISNHTEAFQVIAGTSEDLAQVLHWLEREYTQDDEGFWCNRSIIERSCERGDFWVIRQGGTAVAFQVGEHSPDIVCVKKDLRKNGFGTALFEAALERSYLDNINVMIGECSPRESFPFWKKHGFVPYGSYGSSGGIPVYRTLPRNLSVPSGLPSVDVEIDFFDEDIKYGKNLDPIVTFHGEAAQRSNGSVQLAERIICPRLLARKDVVVRVVVDGKELCFDKAKYDGPELVGVFQGADRNSFYLDRISMVI